ncbi:MAG: hypothetical protein VXY93_14650, partial [Pseudomonadota bacterium]|nr:hypothetical protein [Pseudomonadota bacterium]
DNNNYIAGTNGALQFTTGSSGEKLRILSDGKVGIGSTNPHRTLVLETGDGDIHCLDGNGGIYMGTDNSGGFQKNCAIARAGANNFHIGGSEAGDLCIAGESGQSMIFGVSPFAGGMDTFLHVSRLRNFNFYGTDYKFHTGSTERFNIQNNGNIGIGTDNPADILDINSDQASGVSDVYIRNHANLGGVALNLWTQGTYNSPQHKAIIGCTDAGGTIRMGAASDHPLLLLVNNNEKLRINTDGNVGINSTEPTAKLEVLE